VTDKAAVPSAHVVPVGRATCFCLRNLSVHNSRAGKRRDCSMGRASKGRNDKVLEFRDWACLLSVFCDQIQGKAAGIPSAASDRAGTEDIRTSNMVLSLFSLFLTGAGSRDCAWGSFPVDSSSSYSCNICPWITCPSYRSLLLLRINYQRKTVVQIYKVGL
jgi:hypothetical protein